MKRKACPTSWDSHALDEILGPSPLDDESWSRRRHHTPCQKPSAQQAEALAEAERPLDREQTAAAAAAAVVDAAAAAAAKIWAELAGQRGAPGEGAAPQQEEEVVEVLKVQPPPPPPQHQHQHQHQDEDEDEELVELEVQRPGPTRSGPKSSTGYTGVYPHKVTAFKAQIYNGKVAELIGSGYPTADAAAVAYNRRASELGKPLNRVKTSLKGVYPQANGTFRSNIYVNGKNILVGSGFRTPEDAARAYNKRARELGKETYDLDEPTPRLASSATAASAASASSPSPNTSPTSASPTTASPSPSPKSEPEWWRVGIMSRTSASASPSPSAGASTGPNTSASASASAEARLRSERKAHARAQQELAALRRAFDERKLQVSVAI